MPNQGIHSVSGPNGCPAREKRLTTWCDVCASLGRVHIVYEDFPPEVTIGAPLDTGDSNVRAPKVISTMTREEGLQAKLNDHIRAFHITAARQRGLRRDP
jgi:hypothetical protein